MRRRVTVLVVCVCLSVTTLVATSVVSTLKVRYVGVYLRLSRFSHLSAYAYCRVLYMFIVTYVGGLKAPRIL